MESKRFISRINIKDFAIYIFFIALFVFLAIFAKGFLSLENLINVARQVSITGIVAAGATLVMLAGGIDLSIGSVLAATMAFSAYLMVNIGLHPVIGVLAGLALGGIIGLMNGILITKLNIPPLITTLATMTGARGLTYIITKGASIFGFSRNFKFIGQGYIAKIPVPVIIMIVVLFITFFILNNIPFGRHIYGIGGNEEAARLSGVNVNKVKLIVYIIGGVLAGLGGIILLSRMGTGTPTAGNGFELEVITAVVLGGVSISGGEGKLRGVVIGVLIMGILSNGLVILNVVWYYQWIVRMIVLLIAVGFDRNFGRAGLSKS